MSKDKPLTVSTILVELDALLDTRLSTLLHYNESILDEVLKLNTYHHRLADKYPRLSIDAFYEQYGKRDKRVLQNTMITPVVDIVKSFVFRTLKHSLNSPFQFKPKVIVNVYPYVLTEDEVATIISSLVTITEHAADVEAVNASYDSIDPYYVKKNISIMVLYEYHKWLDIHSVNNTFNKVTCPEVGLIGPELYFKEFDVKQDHSKVFRSMEQLAQPIIALQLIPVSEFSMVLTKP